MNRLAEALAEIVRGKVRDAAGGRPDDHPESRFIFHGPPLELLMDVFDELTRDDGPQNMSGMNAATAGPPVLLQLPAALAPRSNPAIGVSGKCDENHLLDIRNSPNGPSFLALMPPGQHSNMSVTSTTAEFGMHPSSNTGHATFDEWWADGFVQELVSQGLAEAGLGGDFIEDARLLVARAAAAMDEVERDDGSRMATWRLLSRIYSIRGNAFGLVPAAALALACGTPPAQAGAMTAKPTLRILEQIAEEMTDGFKPGVDRIASMPNASAEAKEALLAFLTHVQTGCEVQTAFERATQAFYLPKDTLVIEAPPDWWTTLTVERWSELLSEELEEVAGDLSIACTNAILPVTKGLPAVVVDHVELAISVMSASSQEPVEVLLSGGSHGKKGISLDVPGTTTHGDDLSSLTQKAPTTYKVSAAGRKAATAKVISLASWVPGIIVACRMATKLVPPKKPASSRAGVDWETLLSLPGSGRYEILLLAPTGTVIVEVAGVADDASERVDDGREVLQVHEIRPGYFQVEVEADGSYQLEVTFQSQGVPDSQICKAYITCEEAREEGCRSEFERLIKLNRAHLEKFDAKAVVQVDRHARCSSLQSWMLEDQNVSQSFIPLVLADDYAAEWAPPRWAEGFGPILSQARFLHDPRPATALFNPPEGFIDARREIAARVRNTSDQSGLLESAPLGKWLSQDSGFRALVESYLDAYSAWIASDGDIACWVDVIAVCPREADGRTLSRIPDAIILSPLHPLRLAWHCLAQQVLFDEVDGDNKRPCPAASILDPDCVPDLLTLSLQAPGGPTGIDRTDFLSVECNSDYWSVLWNGSRLGDIAAKSRQAPFDSAFGLVVGGISSGFSPAQVSRALEDVSDLLAAKPIISLVVSSAGGATDACNEGLAVWCSRRFGTNQKATARQGVGPRILEVFDTRPASSRPDQAAIANLSEDTSNHVRWFDRQPLGTRPDLGIIAQLDSAQPASTNVGMRSPLGYGGLIRHRIRRQLHGAFLAESRQGMAMPSSGDTLADKVSGCMVALECVREAKVGLQFAPNVHSISNMIEDKKAGFVAVSSSAIDPACFLGGWVRGTYLWDYDLPSYSHRAGDTSGYYLLSQVRDADSEALGRVLSSLPGCRDLATTQVEQILLEVARRGIPTVRGLSGDDTGATGDLGLFLAARLFQDQFRLSANFDSLLPVLSGSPDDASIAILIPVDPFRGYLADLARSLGKERKDTSLSRPDLLVVGIRATGAGISLHLTPVEVKCRQGSTLAPLDAREALAQARSLASLLQGIKDRAAESVAWQLAYQHLLLSMIGFGLRVYSQQKLVATDPGRWAGYHERIAAAILSPSPSISVDPRGRLVVIDGSTDSEARDHDGDGFKESIVISPKDAGRMVAGKADVFYEAVRSSVGEWQLFPPSFSCVTAETSAAVTPTIEPDIRYGGIAAHEPASAVTEISKADEGTELTSAGEPVALPPEISVVMPDKGIVIAVGRTVDGFEPRALSANISDTRLNQLNMGVVGDLGTGKTQLLKSLILQIVSAQKENRGIKPRFLIFDYKKDYSSPDFVAATGARVVKPTHLPLNLFDTSSMGESAAPWLDRFRFFADVLSKVYAGIGLVQRDKLKGAVRAAYDFASGEGRQPTIYDIHTEYRELLAGKSDSPMSIIDDLVDMQVFEKDPSKTQTFNEFLDGVVVISLDALGQDDQSKNMLVAIMLNMFYENMLKTPKRPFVGTNPQLRVVDSYLLVDEADNIMRYDFDVLRKLLLQGREFGAGVILASQYLRHFKTSATDYREPLLTWFIHKVPNITAAELGALGLASDLGDVAERVKNLANHHCLYKSFDMTGEVIRGLPFYELNQTDSGKLHGP